MAFQADFGRPGPHEGIGRGEIVRNHSVQDGVFHRKTSLNALSQRASQLPSITIEPPQHLIGRNTLECMQSGILHGTAAMIDGLIDKLLPTFTQPPYIIATGGMAKSIIPHCQHQITCDPYLLFKGLFNATH